jgi:hypothetical protein
MNASDVLERLVDAYADAPAPAPSRGLASRIEAGWIGTTEIATTEEERRLPVVVPLTPRPRVRMRYLVAAVVATFVVGSGLAVAGALPSALQRRVASVVSHIGIDLPTPDAPSGPRRVPADGGTGGTGGTGGGGSGATVPAPGGSSSADTPVAGSPGSGGTEPATGATPGAKGSSDPVPTTTALAAPGGAASPTSVPPTTLPGALDAPTTLPPITLPLNLPPVTIPPILPLLGL